MSAYLPFNGFLEKLATGQVNLATDQLALALTSADNPPSATDDAIGDITPIDLTNLAGNMLLTTQSSAIVLTNGYQVTVADKQITADGGPIGPFRWAVVYDQTTGDLISFYDLADDITVSDENSMNFDFSQVTGLLRIGYV